MNQSPKIARLRSMMRAYEGPRHSVVGVGLRNGAPTFISAGAKAAAAPCDDWIFEIGSITKVFTGILLCVLIEEGKVDPRAPLRDMADDLADVPDWITPERLTSHTSGLPRIHVPLWQALRNPLPADPYAAFSRSDLLEWMRNWSGKASRGKRRHAYSNLGIGLLGEAMAMAEGKPFSDLLAEKVIAPLGLKDTAEHLAEDQQDRFAQPSDTKGRDAPAWTFQSMAAAGCLRSSAADLARFSARVIQALHAPETTLDRAICRSVMPIHDLGGFGSSSSSAQCAGWFRSTRGKDAPTILHHDGGTAGSTCAIYICPDKAEACAILSNNGVAANLWASARLSWSNQIKQADALFREK